MRSRAGGLGVGRRRRLAGVYWKKGVTDGIVEDRVSGRAMPGPAVMRVTGISRDPHDSW